MNRPITVYGVNKGKYAMRDKKKTTLQGPVARICAAFICRRSNLFN